MTTNVYELARLIAGVDEQQWNDDLPEYVRVKHTQAAQRLITAGFSAPPAVNPEDTAATNERETLDLAALRHDVQHLVYISDGTRGSNRLARILQAVPSLIDLAATQRPDDREATLRAAVHKVTEQRDAFLSSPNLDPAWIAGWHAAIDQASAALAAADGSPSDSLRQHRLDWADWLESWNTTIGPVPPTVEHIIRWLRADSLPFGVSAVDGSPS